MDPHDPRYSDEDHIFSDTDSLENGGDTLPNSDVWPALQWRGDLTKRHLTAGTLLSVISANGGDQGEFGIAIPTVELEIRRIAAKYGGKNSSDPGYGKTINGENLYSTVAELRAMLHGLVTVSRVAEYRDSDYPTDTTRIRLTADGAALLENAYMAASRDRRFEHIDLADPILEYDCTSDSGTTVETLAIRESLLPVIRNVEYKPYFRPWLWIVANNPITWAVLRSKLDPTTPALYHEGAIEGSEYLAAAFAEASKTPITGGTLPLEYWAARIQADNIGPFARAILSGGPDGMWVAKPLKPEAVHPEIEALAAAKVPGFDDEMVRRSSLAWELFEQDEFSLAQYTELRAQMDAAQTDSLTITVHHLEDPETFSGDEKSDEKSLTSEIDEKLDKAELKVTKKGVTGGPAIEKLIMKKSSDALLDSALGREVLNPGDALTPGKLMRVRCDYILNSSKPDKRRSCDRWSIGGSSRCEIHGGEYLDIEETKSLLNASRSKLVSLQSKAIDVVADLMLNSNNDPTRLMAARIILDRSGFHGQMDVNFTVTSSAETSPADIVAQRLARLAPAAAEIEAKSEADDANKLFTEDRVLEAEVVEDPE